MSYTHFYTPKSSPDLVLEHTACEFPAFRMTTTRDLAAGETITVCTPSFRLVYQCELTELKAFDADNRQLSDEIAVKTENGKPVRDLSARKALGSFEVKSPLPAGTQIELQLSPLNEIIYAGGDCLWQVRLAVIDEQEYQSNICRFPHHDVAEVFEIQLTASTATQIQANRRFNGELVVRAADAYGITAKLPDSKAEADDKSIELSEGHGRVTLDASVQECLKVTTPEGFIATANPLPQVEDGHNVFFGDIHWHTEHSTDGCRSMESALKSCRDELGLDFAGPSEHVLREGDYGRSDTKDQLAICQQFDEAGRFAVIPGFENSRRYGHANVYTETWEQLLRIAEQFDQGFNKVLASSSDRYFSEELMELFEADNTLLIPHHSNMRNESGTTAPDGRSIWTAFNWPRLPNNKHMRLIEMNQQRGAFEMENSNPIWQPPFWRNHGQCGLGGSAQTALLRGHRIGFIGGTDNHHGWPTLEGDANLVGGVTGVIAKELSGPSVFRALHARNCYATTGPRMVAHATLNDQLIGSELTLEPNTERRFKIRIEGTAPIERVEMISFGSVIHSFEVEIDRSSFAGEWIDARPERPIDNVHYYIRARQTDGNCIWLSPWWVDQV